MAKRTPPHALRPLEILHHHVPIAESILSRAKYRIKDGKKGLGVAIRAEAQEYVAKQGRRNPSYHLEDEGNKRRMARAIERQAAAIARGGFRDCGEPTHGDNLCRACAKFNSNSSSCQRGDAGYQRRREKEREVERERVWREQLAFSRRVAEEAGWFRFGRPSKVTPLTEEQKARAEKERQEALTAHQRGIEASIRAQIGRGSSKNRIW